MAVYISEAGGALVPCLGGVGVFAEKLFAIGLNHPKLSHTPKLVTDTYGRQSSTALVTRGAWAWLGEQASDRMYEAERG
jgi:hypothetical protein